jgi:hypothetical protein
MGVEPPDILMAFSRRNITPRSSSDYIALVPAGDPDY